MKDLISDKIDRLETLGMKPVGTLTQGDLDGYLSLNAEILEDLKAECNLPAKGRG